MSRLYVYNSISKEMEVVSTWHASEVKDSNFRFDFTECKHPNLIDNALFNPDCDSGEEITKDNNNLLEYCLPISSQKKLLGIIQFQLKGGEDLTAEQIEIFNSIRPELALAYKATWKHKTLAEMRIIETALAERHSMLEFLHDNLSQNLAFIIMKLDQIIKEENSLTGNHLQADFKSMKDAAHDSYKIVRGILENNHPDTSPSLFNLLKEYLKKISSRSEILTFIEEKGSEIPLLPETQKIIFYLFEEALSNIEKHAQAKNINVLVEWGIDRLNLSIKDDGVGFNTKNLNGYDHFGFTIMKERIKKIEGQLDIQSNVGSGTNVFIYVPIESA
jgi:signal transduction histidine kinase